MTTGGCIGRRLLLCLASLLALWHGAAAADRTDIPFKIDEATAQRLASEGHYGSDKQRDAFDYGPRIAPPFFGFDGVNADPYEGSFGFFAVNPWTGDVWDLWDCRRLSTPLLRKSQAEIRRRFSREERKQYARLRRLKPECM